MLAGGAGRVNERIGRIRKIGRMASRVGTIMSPPPTQKACGDAHVPPAPRRVRHPSVSNVKLIKLLFPRQCCDSNYASLQSKRGMQEPSTEAPPEPAHRTRPRLRPEGGVCCKRGSLSTLWSRFYASSAGSYSFVIYKLQHLEQP